MSERARLVLLISIMVVVALASSIAARAFLYNAAFDKQRARLVEAAQSQARLIESIARFDINYSQGYPGGPLAATMSQIRTAHKNYEGFGETSEFALARRQGSQIRFILRHRHHDLDRPLPVPFSPGLAEPMRRALSGKSGTVIGQDYRGVRVLAAHEPVAILDIGLVAKIDLAAIRKPFITAAVFVLVIILVLTVIGAVLFLRLFNPVIDRLSHTVTGLADAQQIARLGNWNWDLTSNRILFSDEAAKILGLPSGESDATRDSLLTNVHPEDKANLDVAVVNTIKQDTPYELDVRVLIPGEEEKLVHEQGKVTRDNGGNAVTFSGTVQDITERHRAQSRAREVEEELRRVDRMGDMGQITSAIAHELG